MKGKGENYLEKNNLLKSSFISLNGFLQNAIGKKIIIDADPVNDVYKLTNGSLSAVYNADVDIQGRSESIIELYKYIKLKNIDFLYVQAPSVLDSDEQLLPYGIENLSAEKIDVFLSNLSGGGVPLIDLRKEMKEQNISFTDAFFRTDHHWKPETGLWAFGEIAKNLNEAYGYDISEKLWDINNYNVEVKEDWFLGSRGKRVGPYYAGVDDISLITPKFDTDLRIEIPSLELELTGAFENTLIDHEKISERDYYRLNPYAAYSYWDECKTITNYRAPNNKKVLLVRDSFAGVVTPFLSLGCETLDVVDLRRGEIDSLCSYIEETNPDIVLFLYYTGSVCGGSDLQNMFFDFS